MAKPPQLSDEDAGEHVKPPAWDDWDALVEYIARVLATAGAILRAGMVRRGEPLELADKLRRARALPAQGRIGPRLDTPAEINRMLEDQAVEAAQAGNFGPLALLLRSDHPMNKPEYERTGPLTSNLSAETYELIANIMSGEQKRPKNRPPETDTEHRARNPKHDAADRVPGIERLLRNLYKGRGDKEIEGRAISIAAHLGRIDDETLRKFMAKHKTPTLARLTKDSNKPAKKRAARPTRHHKGYTTKS